MSLETILSTYTHTHTHTEKEKQTKIKTKETNRKHFAEDIATGEVIQLHLISENARQRRQQKAGEDGRRKEVNLPVAQ